MDNQRLDALINGLTATEAYTNESRTQTPVTPKRKSKAAPSRAKQKKQEEGRNEVRFCTIVDSDVIKKIRIIATREGLQIKNVVEAALEKAICIYEHKYGVIEEDPKKNLKKLF